MHRTTRFAWRAARTTEVEAEETARAPRKDLAALLPPWTSAERALKRVATWAAALVLANIAFPFLFF